MNPTKLIQTIVAIVAVTWLFAIGFVLGTRSVRNDVKAAAQTTSAVYSTQAVNPYSTTTAPYSYYSPTTTQPVPSTSASLSTPVDVPSQQQTQPVTTQPAVTQGTAVQSTAPAQTSSVPSTKKEIVDAYISAVNKTKSTPNFTLNREDTLNLSLDSITGGSLVKSIANQIVAAQAPHTVQTLTYVNGVDTSGSGENIIDSLPPLGAQAALDPNGVSNATCTPNSYGGYTITIDLADETQTIGAPATNHASTMEVVDIAAIGLPDAFEMTQLDIYYSGSNIKADTDAEGRIVSMKHYLNVTHAEGGGKYGAISINATLHGDFVCTYTATY